MKVESHCPMYFRKIWCDLRNYWCCPLQTHIKMLNFENVRWKIKFVCRSFHLFSFPFSKAWWKIKLFQCKMFRIMFVVEWFWKCVWNEFDNFLPKMYMKGCIVHPIKSVLPFRLQMQFLFLSIFKSSLWLTVEPNLSAHVPKCCSKLFE